MKAKFPDAWVIEKEYLDGPNAGAVLFDGTKRGNWEVGKVYGGGAYFPRFRILSMQPM